MNGIIPLICNIILAGIGFYLSWQLNGARRDLDVAMALLNLQDELLKKANEILKPMAEQKKNEIENNK